MSCASHDTPFDSVPRDIVYDDVNRRDVRSLIFHLLYAYEAFDSDVTLSALIDNFNKGFELNIPTQGPLFDAVSDIISNRDELDALIKPLLHNWRFERLGLCTKIILRYALWELQQAVFPPAVIINEAIELAKCFSEKDAYKFINGILDEALKKPADSVAA